MASLTTQRLYAGIGSRQTPPDICAHMTTFAARLAAAGYALRSGGARGADQAFEAGAGGAKEIYRPADATEAAVALAARYHPAWDRCDMPARRLHARNGMIILGADLASPVSVVLCWTADGQASGGTGQGLRIAADHGIPIFNLFRAQDCDAVEEMILALGEAQASASPLGLF